MLGGLGKKCHESCCMILCARMCVCYCLCEYVSVCTYQSWKVLSSSLKRKKNNVISPLKQLYFVQTMCEQVIWQLQ